MTFLRFAIWLSLFILGAFGIHGLTIIVQGDIVLTVMSYILGMCWGYLIYSISGRIESFLKNFN